MIVITTSELADVVAGHNAQTWTRTNVSHETVCGVSEGEFAFGKWDALHVCRVIAANEGRDGGLAVLDRLRTVLGDRYDGITLAEETSLKHERAAVILRTQPVTTPERIWLTALEVRDVLNLGYVPGYVGPATKCAPGSNIETLFGARDVCEGVYRYYRHTGEARKTVGAVVRVLMERGGMTPDEADEVNELQRTYPEPAPAPIRRTTR